MGLCNNWDTIKFNPLRNTARILIMHRHGDNLERDKFAFATNTIEFICKALVIVVCVMFSQLMRVARIFFERNKIDVLKQAKNGYKINTNFIFRCATWMQLIIM